ncbi:helix-turn-helix domain-containing protein [Zhouia sp. PK063]|uniref:helix-turn-helix domain-containing protein n=1 Tax=Zhouia sp. PK063 TaxID=3373602 RepID=UPI0037B8CBC3
MINPNEIIPGVLFYSYLSATKKEKVGFLEHSILVLQVSGHFMLETANQKITMNAGEMILIRRNQLGAITKTPLENENYETIVIALQEKLLRKIAIDEQIEVAHSYSGPANIHIPSNPYLQGYFQSIVPYVRNAQKLLNDEIGFLKVKEAVKLLLHTQPALKTFLFDFSDPYKIDLEDFMFKNYHFNLPIEKFAQLTGRSLATFKRDFKSIFNAAPRQWLQEKRLTEARLLLETKKLKPSEIYFDLGFETLSHFSTAFKKRFHLTPSQVITK